MIVIPMAGVSRRFQEAGFLQPKYMLDLAGRPLFDWAILSFAERFSSEKFLFVLRDSPGNRDFVEQRLAELKIEHSTIVTLDGPTAGQAETVELGLTEIGVADSEPLAIFNIDTIRPGIDLSPIDSCDGWLETFTAPGQNWSFVAVDPQDLTLVSRCTEKLRISDHCCTGLYQFARASSFAEALRVERERPSSAELFVAPLYNHLIASGARIGWRNVHADQVILSGVPAEYEELKANLPPALLSMVPTHNTTHLVD